MSGQRGRCFLTMIAVGLLVGGALIAPLPGGVTPAFADETQEVQQLVERARIAFESFLADPMMGANLRSVVMRAKAVLIYPQILRGAFLFGGSGGTGALVARDEKTNTWGGPAFYTIGQFSFGFQAGADAAEVVLVALTERGLSAFLSTSSKLGADAAVTAGPIGGGAEAATANLSVDILSFSRTKGLYAGVSVNGAVVAVRGSLNQAYYNKDVSPSAILISRDVSNPRAAGLIEAVAKAASGK
jgi:lipid-binding SYLF domain-containing protein